MTGFVPSPDFDPAEHEPHVDLARDNPCGAMIEDPSPADTRRDAEEPGA